jgi:hypothetical protein
LLLGLDDDNAQEYLDVINEHGLDDIIVEIGSRSKIGPIINVQANKYKNVYKYLGFIGDDHRFRTPNWDQTMISGIEEHGGIGICYGDDLLQGVRLATQWFMSSNIVDAFGYMIPTSLIHMYLDNSVMVMGNGLGSLLYFSNVVIEHMHYSRGKSEKDEIYTSVNTPAVSDVDRANFEKWKRHEFPDRLAFAKRRLGLV